MEASQHRVSCGCIGTVTRPQRMLTCDFVGAIGVIVRAITKPGTLAGVTIGHLRSTTENAWSMSSDCSMLDPMCTYLYRGS